jgi:hypothetical protein
MERARTLLIALLLATCSTYAAEPPMQPHLLPVRADLADFQHHAAYFVAVNAALVGPTDTGLTVAVMPSFEKEWGLRVTRDRGAGIVRWATLQPGLWGAMETLVESRGLSQADALRLVSVRVTSSTAPLTPAAAARVDAAWTAMLAAARVPAEQRRTIDGTRYLYYGCKPGGFRAAGLSSSPEVGTPAAALESLVLALRDHAVADAAQHSGTEASVVRAAEAVLRSVSAI